MFWRRATFAVLPMRNEWQAERGEDRRGERRRRCLLSRCGCHLSQLLLILLSKPPPAAPCRPPSAELRVTSRPGAARSHSRTPPELNRHRPSSWPQELICISRLLFQLHAQYVATYSEHAFAHASLPSALRETDAQTHTSFPKTHPCVPAEMQGFKRIWLPRGMVLDFIIQICYSGASGQFVVY